MSLVRWVCSRGHMFAEKPPRGCPACRVRKARRRATGNALRGKP